MILGVVEYSILGKDLILKLDEILNILSRVINLSLHLSVRGNYDQL